MEKLLTQTIQAVHEGEIAFCKYITANDVGSTGGHQSGFHIHIDSWPLLFDTPGTKGKNKDKRVKIRWQNTFETESRFIYYGVRTRNEYRLTRFGKGFPFLVDEYIGSLLVISKITHDFYRAYVLETDDDIDTFLETFNISPGETNGIIPRQQHLAEFRLRDCFSEFIRRLQQDFPPTADLAYNARICYNRTYGVSTRDIIRNPDAEILHWIDAEFQLFKTLETVRYGNRIQRPFASVEELIEMANTILNRRKSRAGKSLEHHLSEIFSLFQLTYTSQAVTEANKKPDFLFPGTEAYHNKAFDEKQLVMLASKTSCKDRWRQILNEADRIRTKHLFTLQQGISRNQLDEMYRSGVCLVVPRQYINSFPAEFQDRILSLQTFIQQVGSIQER